MKPGEQEPMKKTNVVLFITDGQRTDTLGCYGNRLVDTPNIDAFAQAGARFERSFCPHSVCMPTRASIYTGRHPHVHGVWANGVALSADEVTLPRVLAENGYATCAAGKIHFEPQQMYMSGDRPAISDGVRAACPIIEDTPYYGFGEVHMTENLLGLEYLRFIDREHPELAERARKRDRMPEEAHDLQWTTDQAIGFIRRQVESDTPFFCHCSYHELSPPGNPPDTFVDRYDPADVPVPELREADLAKKPDWYRQCYEGYLSRGRHPDEATLRRHIACYYSVASFIDKQFGRLMSALEELGVLDDTIVLFTSDHGLSLNDHFQWRHGPFLFDQVVNVPMIWRVPGMAQRGVVTEELVESVDIMPTVLDLCGAEIPHAVQGQSLRPLICAEPDARGKESVLIQERQAPDLAARGLDPASVTQYGLRTKDWKVIHYQGQPWGELYDLRNDPGEFENLWDDPASQRRRAELEHLLLDRLFEGGEPFPQIHYDW